jgi:hypothetical protein
MERLFAVSSLLVMPFWLLMILVPRWRWTERLARSPFIVAGPVLLYAALVLPELLALLPLVTRPALPAVAALLGQPRGATIAWAHFLALDLFAARWIYLDARERALPAWIVSPLLALTLLFGPLGLGGYLLWRALRPVAGGFVRRLWAGNRPLALLALASGGLLVASLLLLGLDGRQVVGAPVWMKPAKFAASVLMAAATLAWIMGQLEARRGLRRAGRLMAGTLALELVIITVQAARGVPSHFNAATALDGALFSVMGAAITLFWLVEGYLAMRAFRQRFATPARTWGIRLGLAGALVGGALGFAMPRPTAAQRASLRAHQVTPLLGAHAVGVPDGGPGLPVTRWSTEGGDLRVPHFVGLHALQALPLLAWFLERRRRPAARPVIAAAVAWLGLVAVTLAQALRGQPLSSPDTATVAAAALVLAAALAVATVPTALSLRQKAGAPAR